MMSPRKGKLQLERKLRSDWNNDLRRRPIQFHKEDEAALINSLKNSKRTNFNNEIILERNKGNVNDEKKEKTMRELMMEAREAMGFTHKRKIGWNDIK